MREPPNNHLLVRRIYTFGDRLRELGWVVLAGGIVAAIISRLTP
jgi:hypothetical protein